MSGSTGTMQRTIPVFVLGPQGFISGVLHLPALSGLLTFLNTPEEILKLTDVVLPGDTQTYPFMAMQKAAMHLLAPRETLETEVVYMNTTRRLVTCLLSVGSIRGYIEVLEKVRISDFLLRNHGFIEFRSCFHSLGRQVNPKETIGDPLPQVFVNSRSMLGVMESPAEVA